MAYHDGVLETMSPELRHDRGSRRIHEVVMAYCEAFGVPCLMAGTTTARKGRPGTLKGRGKEPDASYFLRNDAEAIRGKDSVDQAVDPPPSLWVEVDNWGSSKTREETYAALGVPEVWRYRAPRKALRFLRLAAGVYEEIPSSASLPGLTPQIVLEALDEADRLVDDAAWRRSLREVWLPAHRQQLIDAGAGG
jgi:Uma2 family endonuclease